MDDIAIDPGYLPACNTEGGLVPVPAPAPCALDRNGAEVRPGDRVMVPCTVRDIQTRNLVLVTVEPIDPHAADPDWRRGGVHWLRPHQVERADAPAAPPGLDVEELVGLCRELVASAGVVSAGRVTVADTPLRWIEATLKRADAKARKSGGA